MTMLPNLTFDCYDEEVTVTPDFRAYGNGRLAITFVESDGMPYGTVTVNMPNDHLAPNEVAVKDWNENEPLVAALIKAGWLVPTGRELASGHVFPKVMRLGGALLEARD